MRFSAEARRDTFAANVPPFVWPQDGAEIIDLSERFRPQPVSRPRDADTEFQAHVDRLLAEKPPQWLEYAFWGAISVMFFGGVIGICACLYS